MNKVRCKLGDLAVVIDARYKCNLGAVVQVIELHHGFGDLRYPTEQNAWLVRSSKVLKWTVDGKRYRRKSGPEPDAQLQPIRGYPLGRDIAEGLKEFKGVLTVPKKSNRKDETC